MGDSGQFGAQPAVGCGAMGRQPRGLPPHSVLDGARRGTHRGRPIGSTAMPASLLAVVAASDAEIADACGEDPGAACRWVIDRIGNEQLATFADFLVARPLKIILICVGAWLLSKVVRRMIRRFVSRLAGSNETGRLARARDRAPSILFTQSQPSLQSAPPC